MCALIWWLVGWVFTWFVGEWVGGTNERTDRRHVDYNWHKIKSTQWQIFLSIFFGWNSLIQNSMIPSVNEWLEQFEHNKQRSTHTELPFLFFLLNVIVLSLWFFHLRSSHLIILARHIFFASFSRWQWRWKRKVLNDCVLDACLTFYLSISDKGWEAILYRRPRSGQFGKLSHNYYYYTNNYNNNNSVDYIHVHVESARVVFLCTHLTDMFTMKSNLRLILGEHLLFSIISNELNYT